MKLPNLPIKVPHLDKKEKSEYFLSLVLRDEKASAVVFREVAGKVNVVGEHSELFKISIEEASEEELLDVIDRAVSTAESTLPEGVESQKTIFGLKQDWIIDGKIDPDYLKKLKKISDELQFKPVGFLVITEALAHLLQIEEGAPVSAIITEVGKHKITVSLVKAGRVLETKSAVVEDSVPKTVDTLLKHFTTAEVLPSRVIIFDNGSEKLAQEFIAHKWSHELGFLHVPQITNLPSNFDARAVLNGAATQMGFEVLEASLARAEKVDAGVIAPIATNQDEDITLAQAASEFGFTSEDVAIKPKTAIEDDAGNDLLVNTDNITPADQFKEIPEEEKIASSDKKPLSENAAAMTTSMKGFFGKIKLDKLKGGGSKKKLLIIAVPIILIILLAGFYFFGRTATVTLGVSSKETTKSATVTFSENSPTSAADDTIHVTFVTSTQDGKISTSATGKKQTGDKAKGTVTIFNSGDSGTTLQAGTTITSSNGLNFTTDKAVTVASSSGDIFSGTDPGKADVTVTAEKFGTNYNLPSDTKFSVSGSSSIAAKNDKAFSGGTTKNLTVVSQKDLDKLTSDLQKQLEEAAKNDISKKATGDEVVLPNFASVKFTDKSFSKKVDDEATDVSLTGTISFEGISYKKSDMVAFAKDKLGENIPDNTTIYPDKST